jgi:hypothetical protein
MTRAIDIERNPSAAFGFYQEFATLDGGWSSFPRHYLLYASSGVFHLEVAQALWLLPPQRAAWIAADAPIRVSIRAPVTCCSVLFATTSFRGRFLQSSTLSAFVFGCSLEEQTSKYRLIPYFTSASNAA